MARPSGLEVGQILGSQPLPMPPRLGDSAPSQPGCHDCRVRACDGCEGEGRVERQRLVEMACRFKVFAATPGFAPVQIRFERLRGGAGERRDRSACFASTETQQLRDDIVDDGSQGVRVPLG